MVCIFSLVIFRMRILQKSVERIYGRLQDQSLDKRPVVSCYGLKSSGAAFWLKLEGILHGIYYDPTNADPDVWIRTSIKPDRTEYYDMVLCYVYGVLSLSHAPMRTIEGIKKVFKLNGDPDISEDRFHRFDWEDFYKDAA